MLFYSMRNGENKTYVKKNSFNLQLTFFAVKKCQLSHIENSTSNKNNSSGIKL